jgi:hydroxypyruvate isomerase
MKGTFMNTNDLLTRRRLMMGAAAVAAAPALPALAVQDAPAGKAIRNGRLNQSMVKWCFDKHWTVDKQIEVAAQIGLKSVELVQFEHWPAIKKAGLVCAVAPGHGFEKGMNNPKYHEMCLGKIRKGIEMASDFGFPNVITFTGFKEDVSDSDGVKNCVEGYKKIVGLAEEKKVTIVLEILNSRVNIPMKGHPGYQGDHVDYCIDIIKKVGSPRLKLLFDIYHVQIMDGDVITRIRENKEYIGHYHTAGNPGRGELDDKQEINYRPIMEEIAKTGYTGFIGQEFIPTRDPMQGLREAATVCDV